MTGWGWLTATAALGAAVSGGALLTYSGFTARGIQRLPDAQGVAAMQQLNLAAPRSATFMVVLFGPGLLAGALAVRAWVRRDPAAVPVTVGAALLLVGVVGTTVVFHVPRNEALAAMEPATAAAGWQQWLDAWIRGNHVRTVSALLAAAALWVAVE